MLKSNTLSHSEGCISQQFLPTGHQGRRQLLRLFLHDKAPGVMSHTAPSHLRTCNRTSGLFEQGGWVFCFPFPIDISLEECAKGKASLKGRPERRRNDTVKIRRRCQYKPSTITLGGLLACSWDAQFPPKMLWAPG